MINWNKKYVYYEKIQRQVMPDTIKKEDDVKTEYFV